MDERYKNPDNDPKGPWTATDITRAEHRDRDYWGLVTPSGKTVFPAKGRSWSRPKENIEKLQAEGRQQFGPNGSNLPRLKKYLNEMVALLHNLFGFTTDWKQPRGEERDSPNRRGDGIRYAKPERLIHRILHLATKPGDLVLDSFAGSGTTGVVAHKMGRRWIMVELGEHCHAHHPRLKKVIDGDDKGGITEAVEWKGGGGFRYYRVAPSLLQQDRWGNWVINKVQRRDAC